MSFSYGAWREKTIKSWFSPHHCKRDSSEIKTKQVITLNMRQEKVIQNWSKLLLPWCRWNSHSPHSLSGKAWYRMTYMLEAESKLIHFGLNTQMYNIQLKYAVCKKKKKQNSMQNTHTDIHRLIRTWTLWNKNQCSMHKSVSALRQQFSFKFKASYWKACCFRAGLLPKTWTDLLSIAQKQGKKFKKRITLQIIWPSQANQKSIEATPVLWRIWIYTNI